MALSTAFPPSLFEMLSAREDDLGGRATYWVRMGAFSLSYGSQILHSKCVSEAVSYFYMAMLFFARTRPHEMMKSGLNPLKT